MAQKKTVSKKKVAKKKNIPNKQSKKNLDKNVVAIHPMVGWIELNTSEPIKAKEFYSALFGWKTVDEDMPGMGKYTMFGKTLKNFVGGLAPLQDASTQPHWLIYFTVKNVDASSEAAKKLGAKSLAEPMDIPDGRIAVLIDPNGAVFALWAPVKKK